MAYVLHSRLSPRQCAEAIRNSVRPVGFWSAYFTLGYGRRLSDDLVNVVVGNVSGSRFFLMRRWHRWFSPAFRARIREDPDGGSIISGSFDHFLSVKVTLPLLLLLGLLVVRLVTGAHAESASVREASIVYLTLVTPVAIAGVVLSRRAQQQARRLLMEFLSRTLSAVAVEDRCGSRASAH